jgi:hypothetical protein
MALTKKITLLALVLVLGLVLATGALAASAPTGKAEMISGTHWTKWSQEDKLVYIRGLTNWADFIVGAQAQRGNTGEYCMSKVLVDALKTKTLGQIASDVDAYYQKNTGKMSNSVIEAILRGATKICEPGAKEMKK